MTDLYLAFSPSGECRITMKALADADVKLNLLVSYVYLENWDKLDSRPTPAKTILDSGAFSAWKSGVEIDIDALVAETKTGRWDEAVALDVIGDAEASMRNALHMKKCGSIAYPVFHYGDPWEHLAEYCRQFPKVGLSCRFGETRTESALWLDQCFARAYPHKFHSFGYVASDVLRRFPFHSADTASWNNRPSVWGSWKTYGKMSVRGLKNLRAEVEWYLQEQEFLKHRWKNELKKLESQNFNASVPDFLPSATSRKVSSTSARSRTSPRTRST